MSKNHVYVNAGILYPGDVVEIRYRNKRETRSILVEKEEVFNIGLLDKVLWVKVSGKEVINNKEYLDLWEREYE